MQEDIRIVLVGDKLVGKSSLVSSLISDCFVENVSPVISEFIISPEVTGEPVTTRVVDTPSGNEKVIDKEIKAADAIILVYSCEDSDSFDRLTSYWLPHIQRVRGYARSSSSSSSSLNFDKRVCPIILAGNKLDLSPNNYDLGDQVIPITTEYQEVEQCFETSAKDLVNVADLFSCAQHAIIHPTPPLYDAVGHKMTPKCVDAFSRIFKLVDKDRDGLLSDHELSELQRHCFDKPLPVGEIEKVKEVVRNNVEGGIQNGYLNEKGFLFLQLAYIQRGRCSTSWAILRSFGYNEVLDLRDDYLNPKLEISPDQTVELSAKGFQFFTELFLSCDLDHDGALCKDELALVFRTAPCSPWKENFSDFANTNANNNITLQCFLCQWVLTTLTEPKKTLQYLAYLGYPFDTLEAVKISRRKSLDIKKKTQRNSFRCAIFGAPGCGKTSMVRSLIGKSFFKSSSSASINEDYLNRTNKENNDNKYNDSQIDNNNKKNSNNNVNENGQDKSPSTSSSPSQNSSKAQNSKPYTTRTSSKSNNSSKQEEYTNSSINSFSVNGVEKYLALFEISASNLDIVSSPKLSEKYDVAAFLYDSTDPGSFEYCAKLQAKLTDMYVPSIFIATKTDKDEVEQLCNLQPKEYCDLMDLPPPKAISTINPSENIDLFTHLVEVAMKPHLYLPAVEDDDHNFIFGLQVTAGISIVLAIAGFTIVRAMRK